MQDTFTLILRNFLKNKLFFKASGEIALKPESVEEDSNVTTSVIRRRKQQSPADSDLDDFELISGDELDEVSP